MSSSDDSSSDTDGDLVDQIKEKKKLNTSKRLSTQSTPMQSNALTSKLLFQNMLMGSNNKMAEFLKNKQNLSEKKKKKSESTPSPVKGILKTSKYVKREEAELEFDPAASSTQIREVSMTDSPVEVSKKVKAIKKEYASESESSSENELISKRKVIKKEASSSSSDSEEEIRKIDVKKEQGLNKSRKVLKDKVSSSSDDESSDKKSSSSENENEGNKQKSKVSSKSISAKRSRNDSSDDDSDSSEPSKKVKKQKRKDSAHPESESESENNLSSTGSRFKKFESHYKDVQKIEEQCNLLENMKANEEIFLVQIPKCLDPKSLIGKTISLSEVTKVREGARKYECIPSMQPQNNPITIFTNTEKLHLINPSGNLRIQKHTKSKSIPDLSGPSNDEAVPPEINIKQRHPLFGADYSDKIKLEDHIQEKLRAAVDSYSKQKMKKKKHKKKDLNASKEDEQEEIFKFLSQTDSKKSSKIENPTDNSEDFNKKSKKIKKEKVSLELEEQQDEELPVKKKIKKYKKHFYDDNDDDDDEELDSSSMKEHKEESKKKKHNHKNADEMSSDNMEMPSIKQEKKKRKHLDNTSIYEDEVNYSSKKKKPVKQHKSA